MKYQRLISLILVLCMCVSFFPAPAFADDEGESSGNGNAGDPIYVAQIGETKFTSLKAAVEAAVTQDTIVLIADSESDETVVISGKVIHLDLNGHIFSSTNPDQAILVSGDGGVLVLEGPNGSETGIRAGENTAFAIRNEGDMRIEGGTVTAARCAIYTTGQAATTLAGGLVVSTAASPAENPLETFAVRSDHFFYAEENAQVVGAWGAVAIEGGYSEIKSGTFDGGESYGLYVKDAVAPEGEEYRVDVSGGTFQGAVAVYSDLQCHALSVTGGSFSSNPGSHVMRGYAAGRRTVESPYLVGEVTPGQEENSAVIRPSADVSFNVTLVPDEQSATFAPGSVDMIRLSREASEEGLIVGDTTELIAYVDVVGPETSDDGIAYTISPFWRKSHGAGHTLVGCFTDETEITVRLGLSRLSVQEDDLVLARGDTNGNDANNGYHSKTRLLTVQYDHELNYPYVDFACTASPEWVSDWTFTQIDPGDYIAGVIHPNGDYVEYTRLLYAFEDAAPLAGATVIMLKDWSDECNIPIQTDSDITFDLKGKKIDSSWNVYYTFKVASGASLTIIDSSPAKTGEIKGGRAALAVGEGTTLTLKGGALYGNVAGVITEGPLVDVQGGTIHGNEHGILCDSDYHTKVTVRGGKVESHGCTIDEAGSVEVHDGEIYARGEAGIIAISAIGNVTATGGDVYASGDEARGIAAGGNVTVEGGNITATGEGAAAILGQDTVTVSGGSISAEGDYGMAIGAPYVTVEGGTVTSDGALSVALNCGTEGTISGGTVSAGGDQSSAISSLLTATVSGGDISADGEGSAALNNEGTSPFTVTGGNFTGALRARETGSEYIEVSGGVFSQDPTPWLKAGWEAMQDPDDGLWYVEEHVDISAVWEDDYSAATLTVTHVSGETETISASVTLSENEDHTFQITAAGKNAEGRTYSATLENVASFKVNIGDAYSAWMPVAQGKNYAAFTLTGDVISGLTPPAGATLDSLINGEAVYHAGDTVQVTEDTVFDVQWRSIWALVNTALGAGEAVTLYSDITPGEGDSCLHVPQGITATLDLNGHTVDRALSRAVNQGYVLRVDGALDLTGGTVTGGRNTENGGGIYVSGGAVLTANDVIITQNQTQKDGGGIYVADGDTADVTLNNVQITSCTATEKGGGLCLGGSGDQQSNIVGITLLVGGVITLCAGGTGGGVYLYKGKLKLDSGTRILNNTNLGGDMYNNIAADEAGTASIVLPETVAAPMAIGLPAAGAAATVPLWIKGVMAAGAALVAAGLLAIYTDWETSKGEQGGQTCDHPSWNTDAAVWEEEYYSHVDEYKSCKICGFSLIEPHTPADAVDPATQQTTYTVVLAEGEQTRVVKPYIVIAATGINELPDIQETYPVAHGRGLGATFILPAVPWTIEGYEFDAWALGGETITQVEFKPIPYEDEQVVTVLANWKVSITYDPNVLLPESFVVTGAPPQNPNPSWVSPGLRHELLPNSWEQYFIGVDGEGREIKSFYVFDGWDVSVGVKFTDKLTIDYIWETATGVPGKMPGEMTDPVVFPIMIRPRWKSPWKIVDDAINKLGAYKLPADTYATQLDTSISAKTLPLGAEPVLNLNGYKAHAWFLSLTLNPISVGAKLRVIDSSEQKTGQISDGKSIKNGGGVNVGDGALFTLESGSIKDNITVITHLMEDVIPDGGGVMTSGGFVMESGIITGNSAPGNGGGVCIDGSGSFQMTGGEISGNKARYDAVSRETVSGSTAQGGGVYVGGSFSVSGRVVIKNNTVDGSANNVYLPSGKTITVAGKLDEQAEIHVSMETPGVFTSGLKGNSGDEAWGSAGNFVSDDANYEVFINADGEAELRTEVPVLFVLPQSLTRIGQGAFEGIAAEKVMILSNVTAIEARAFADCKKLREITIPASVTEIDDSAFDTCAGVTVYGVSGSEAERIAVLYNFTFVPSNPQ